MATVVWEEFRISRVVLSDLYLSLLIVTVHYALSNGANDQVINALLKFQPDAARGFDKRGWTP